MFVPRTLRNHSYTIFFAPRGRKRIFELGMQISQQYLSPTDQIIGLIG
ncbi:MAG: alanine-tRNA synthetase second additional domain-containing protein, partial [Ruminococcaceae bacterium]|nr:alanine-tRNA synthetase second additional domain-containing protein [Oscillospiraceae bacterium]